MDVLAHVVVATLFVTYVVCKVIRLVDQALPQRGSDGLTYAERHAYAESWRNGAGRTPSKDEMRGLHRPA